MKEYNWIGNRLGFFQQAHHKKYNWFTESHFKCFTFSHQFFSFLFIYLFHSFAFFCFFLPPVCVYVLLCLLDFELLSSVCSLLWIVFLFYLHAHTNTRLVVNCETVRNTNPPTQVRRRHQFQFQFVCWTFFFIIYFLLCLSPRTIFRLRFNPKCV